MTHLRDLTGETVGLSVRVGDEMLHVEQVVSTSALRRSFEIGRTLPLWCGAPSRLFLADLPEAEVREILRRRRPSAVVPADPPSARKMSAAVREARESGCSTAYGETIAGVNTVAAGLYAADGHVDGDALDHRTLHAVGRGRDREVDAAAARDLRHRQCPAGAPGVVRRGTPPSRRWNRTCSACASSTSHSAWWAAQGSGSSPFCQVGPNPIQTGVHSAATSHSPRWLVSSRLRIWKAWRGPSAQMGAVRTGQTRRSSDISSSSKSPRTRGSTSTVATFSCGSRLTLETLTPATDIRQPLTTSGGVGPDLVEERAGSEPVRVLEGGQMRECVDDVSR